MNTLEELRQLVVWWQYDKDCPAKVVKWIDEALAASRAAPVQTRRSDGMPNSADERYLRHLLAAHAAMPNTYTDDGEASGQESGITIDFMREPVADIDAKLRAMNVARLERQPDPHPVKCLLGQGKVEMSDGTTMYSVDGMTWSRDAAQSPPGVVGWLVSDDEGNDDFVNNPDALAGRHYKGRAPIPLTAAPQRQPQTDERVRDAFMATNTRSFDQLFAAFRDGFRAVERAHGITGDRT